MVEFIETYWSEILSVIGSAAWLPIIISPIFNCFRKVQATVLDLCILPNGESISALKSEKKNGAILMLALYFFVNKVIVFARNISVSVFLNNGAQLSTVLLDFSLISANNGNDAATTYSVPIEQELNISRIIHPGVDNIKYVSLLVENVPALTVDDIKKIEIRLFYTRYRWDILPKKVVITAADFPAYNASRLIRRIYVPTDFDT